jgi:DNA-directed RNA polymerase subunit D
MPKEGRKKRKESIRMMKIKLVNRDEKKGIVSFEVSGAEAAYMNTLRRLLMTEVPVLSVEDIEFKKNDSGLYDEMVAHRLGLMPLKTDLKSYNLPSECKCKGEGCARCQLKLTLKAKGPCVVYASDIKSKDPKVKPVYGKTPIVKLLENQELELEMTAIMGIGRTHAKWSPCLSYYRELADVKIDGAVSNGEEIAKRCPTKVFSNKNDKLTVENPNDCVMCGECVALSKGKIKVEGNGSYLMTIESWGQLEPEEIVEAALEAYNGQLEHFTTLVSKVK